MDTSPEKNLVNNTQKENPYELPANNTQIEVRKNKIRQSKVPILSVTIS